jgi:hypothetical protein
MISDRSGGKTHTEQLETGHIDIHGQFFHTSESATYTILLLTTGSSKHGGYESIIFFGTGGR